MMTLQQILEAKIATARAELAKVEADLATLVNSGSNWLQTEEEQLKAWFEAEKSHLGL